MTFPNSGALDYIPDGAVFWAKVGQRDLPVNLPDATTEIKGISRQATQQEVDDGADVDAYVPPDLLQQKIDNLPDATTTQKGVVEKATTSEAESGASDKFPDAAGMIAAISAKSLGTVYQDYTDVSSIRQAGVVYTNTDSAPRYVTISDSSSGRDEDRYQVRKDSSSPWVTVGRNSDASGSNVGFIVPPGFQYRANSFVNLNHWSELSL